MKESDIKIDISSLDVSSLDRLREWVEDFLSDLPEKQLVLLNGEMGAGKTQMVKFILAELTNKEDEVTSPTFALHNEYIVNDKIIDHVDLYRLQSEEDLESTGFWDLFEKEDGLILVEWADKIDRSHYPMNWPVVNIQLYFEDKKRMLKIIE